MKIPFVYSFNVTLSVVIALYIKVLSIGLYCLVMILITSWAAQPPERN